MSQVLVSACLLGRPCRYDGTTKTSSRVRAWAQTQETEGVELIPVCPEELGGLGTPRPAAELRGGDGAAVLSGLAKVETRDETPSRDLTRQFLAGAHAAAASSDHTTTAAVLKARSPSCGCGKTWIDGEVQPGDGVFAALLKQRGITVMTEEDLP